MKPAIFIASMLFVGFFLFPTAQSVNSLEASGNIFLLRSIVKGTPQFLEKC